MQIGVNIKRRVDRMDSQKANRLRMVDSLPETAEQGDMVLFEKTLFVHADGFWRNIDDAVMGQVKALDARLSVLEGNDDG